MNKYNITIPKRTWELSDTYSLTSRLKSLAQRTFAKNVHTPLNIYGEPVRSGWSAMPNWTLKEDTLAQMRKKTDMESFGTWGTIPNINTLSIGDTFVLPHVTGWQYYHDMYTASVELEVFDKKTIKTTKEYISEVEGKSKTVSIENRIKVAVARDYNPLDILYVRHKTQRKRTKTKQEFWLSQRDIFELMLKDGGLCPFERAKSEFNCQVCN